MKRLYLLPLILALQACQQPVCLYIYNAHSHPVTYSTFHRMGDWGIWQKRKILRQQRVFRIKQVFHFSSYFTLTTPTGIYCYEPPRRSKRFSSDWVYTDEALPIMYTVLGEDKKIYLFDKKSFGKDDYYRDVIPDQPEDFPIEPLSNDECEKFIQARA